jgi:hypothetical protein
MHWHIFEYSSYNAAILVDFVKGLTKLLQASERVVVWVYPYTTYPTHDHSNAREKHDKLRMNY